VKLGGSVLAVVLLENGRQVRARMNQLSVNGGLLSLEHPLDEGIKVTTLFHLGTTSIRTRAEMLFPMWATKGCFQPFRFMELPEHDRNKFRLHLQFHRYQQRYAYGQRAAGHQHGDPFQLHCCAASFCSTGFQRIFPRC